MVVDAARDRLEVRVEPDEFARRAPASFGMARNQDTNMHQLFGFFRHAVGDAVHGASVFGESA
jgi:dihydroxyacid dehydratase/phosphogluconate dehydratase